VLYSILQAETKGFLEFFTAYRKHLYKATFDIVDEGKRLRPSKLSRKVIIGDVENTTDHSFDYKTRTHKWKKLTDNKAVKSGSRIIPLAVNFDDIHAVFYNFRNSAYGKNSKRSRVYYLLQFQKKKLIRFTSAS